MTMFNKDQIFQLLESRDGEALRALWQGRGAVDIAALLDSVEDSARQAAVFRTLPKDLAADVFSYLPGPTQATLARSFADGELQQIFDALHLDDAADFLEELPANLVTRILRSASPQRRMAVNALLRYPADSAGSVMTPEFVSLRPGDTVRQALDTIRRTGIHKETVYTCYVLEHRQLLGVVSAKDLLTAAEDAAVADLAKYDLLALPVLDGEERMVGIVTVDDAMDVLTEAAAEDLSIMAAVTPDEKPYFAASAWEHARHRVVWLLILMLSAAITGSIITRYEDAISAVPLLVAFLPMLMDTGGNCGSQSATLVIRGLALEEIRPRDALRVIRKELAVAAIVSAVLAAANGLRIYLQYHDSAIALVISFGTSTAISHQIGSSLLSQVTSETYETVNLTGENEAAEEPVEDLNLAEIEVAVSGEDYAMVWAFGMVLCVASTALAAYPIMKMKPKSILSQMS